MERDLAIVRDLCRLYDPATARPIQFKSLLTGTQYLPLYRLTRRYARPGMAVLDWGSGNGHFSYFLMELGLDVTAFNLKSQKCLLAHMLRTRHAERYSICFGDDAEPVRLPFGDDSFDMAFSIGVLEHVREAGGSELASLTELRRVLKPGGFFVCGFLPKKYSWIEFLVRNFFKQKHHHRHRFTRQGIGDMLERSDFELIDLATHGFLPRNSLNRSLTNRAGVARWYNLADRLLEQGLAPIAQNFMLCAMKPLSAGSCGAEDRARATPAMASAVGLRGD
jgi:SAM-dependent methyltransferase